VALSTAAAVFLFLGLVWARSALRPHPAPRLELTLHPAEILADGDQPATLMIHRPSGEPSAGAPKISVTENVHGAMVQEIREVENGWRVQLRVGVIPGRVLVRADVPGFLPGSAELTAKLDPSDSAGDGTPDFLRLDDEHDQQAFRSWFTFLAEAQYFQRTQDRPAEITDCAALIRYAYREALHAHENGWAEQARLPIVAGLEAVAKYQYPYTPLGAALFRVRPGPFRSGDLADGAFAQFADAQTLERFNTHFVGRELARALPGDLLFFRRFSARMPFHSMIFLGHSQISRETGTTYLLYHTGPEGLPLPIEGQALQPRPNPGEIRRLTVEELMRHPDPQWHPIQGNPSFLGVYRWNILRKVF